MAQEINKKLDYSLTKAELAWLEANFTEAAKIDTFLIGNTSLEAKAFAKEITSLISLETTDQNNTLSFVLQAFSENKIYNSLDYNFLNTVNQYMVIDASNVEFTDPIIQYFIFKIATLKALNPEWPKTKVFWEATKDGIHISLDVFGLIPVVGEIADLTNGVLYAIEGDGVNATLSFASAIPIVGYGSVATKYGLKIVKASTIGTKVKLVWKITADGVAFGSRGTLRKVLGITDSALHAHHLIPWARKGHNLIQKAANSKHAFHLNEALNGISRLNDLHLTGHNRYNDKVLEILDKYDKVINPNASFDEAYNFVIGLANHIRTLIKNNPTLNSGQIADLIRYP
ncbi:AHH domain-containing protein [Tenacibaculum tangerinum]|uniref:AHH domain-containing protein n=1 Tax=Tenacibaculum tangerinum TaxID=3038772 RepID=A0ABY8L6Q4_9FLAO|nr:AHH domain-containing protein [Tenacibaculum tangerinum]WGH75605.1 AHH domain-containing protein [Tenacibaculum tangerinum]